MMRTLLLAASMGLWLAYPPPLLAESGVPWTEPKTGMSFIRVAPACFKMGTPKAPWLMNEQNLIESGYKGDHTAHERPVHRVCLSEYWIARHEVRADEWERIMKSPPPRGRGAEPAAGITWAEAVLFAEKLTAEGGGKLHYRLPSEAEWEYACLAGQPELLKDESDIGPLARQTVFWGIYENDPPLRPGSHYVGSRQSNAWGLFDMRGNVAEWVADTYTANAYRRHALYDPVIAGNGQRVIRGGSYRSQMPQLRCASRSANFADQSLPSVGLRLVRKAKP